MRRTVLLVALASALTLAGDNAAVAPRPSAVLQSTLSNPKSPETITIPQMLSYQGRLTDTLGQPVPNGSYTLRFRLYTEPSGGGPFWTESQSVNVRGGLFHAMLGAVSPIYFLPDSGELYLGLQVESDPELSPRLRIVSAAYAYVTERAANSDRLQGKDSTGFVRTGQTSSITSAMIVDGAVAAVDLGQMGAGSGQVMKWSGSAWDPANDSVGTADNAWVRVGSDSVLYTINSLGLARGGAGNALYGPYCYSHVNLGTACTTGTSGQNSMYNTICGGNNNTASGDGAALVGGFDNVCTGATSFVGGGSGNATGAAWATVGGGQQNSASGQHATVGGGDKNNATGAAATASGGYQNSAGGDYAVIGGGQNNSAGGVCATVAGGMDCAATGNYSFASGRNAQSESLGCFTWGDANSGAVTNSTNNRWLARAAGGVYFYTSPGMTTGSYLDAGGSSWQSVSDSMTKENFRAVDKKALLDALARMRVRDYNLKSQDPSIRHVGPVAQEFHSSFGFGESNTAINMEDADGVLMAAVQALYEQNQQLFDQNREMKAELEALKAELQRKQQCARQ